MSSDEPMMSHDEPSHCMRPTSDAQTTIVEAGAIRPLVSMLKHGAKGALPGDDGTLKRSADFDAKADAQKWAAGALAAVAAGSQMNKIAVADEGGIPPLVEVLTTSDDL
jgi:hypothetical protein